MVMLDYHCKLHVSDQTTRRFNIVFAGTAIGLDHEFCGLYLDYDQNFQCCLSRSPVIVDTQNKHIPTNFYALGPGDVNITVQQSWITPAAHHYHTDLGLMLDKQVTSSYTLFKVNFL